MTENITHENVLKCSVTTLSCHKGKQMKNFINIKIKPTLRK